MRYADVIIENRSDNTDRSYTYGCGDLDVAVGSKVYVPFAGGSRLREAYVVSLKDDVEEGVREKLRYIDSVDEDVSLSEEMIRTALWMKRRYVCRYIDAIDCFTPAGGRAKRGERKDPFAGKEGEKSDIEKLTEQQERVLGEINSAVRSGKHARFLLHGVTGSGKTEVYMRAAAEVLRQGRSVMILVPEISLTGQIIERFIGRFGTGTVAVLHSRLTTGERYDQWKKIKDGKVKIVIGARSAVFAPLEDIGLAVIDEEHESTYKSDHTPKYDTAEVVLKRLSDRDNSGVLLLGSATPSIVSYSRGREGIYRILELTERYNRVELPYVHVADMRKELHDGNRTMISGILAEKMREHLAAGRQAILLLNRRGYSTFISCRSCGYVAKCPECGVSLTYHRADGCLMCHYCGHREKAPEVCPECGSRYIKYFGSGTEKLEETVQQIFPEAQVDRVDLDTVKKRGELSRKLGAFGKGKTDILIGTQLIAKGLDFRNVGIAGIVSADVSLNIPDFRSAERTFQLITQAAGRAGRGDIRGDVVIQTYDTDNYAVRFAAAQDYRGFYETETGFRKLLGYPPFSDLFQIVFTAEKAEKAEDGAFTWYEKIRKALPDDMKDSVFRPQEAYLGKIKDRYRYSMLIKCPAGRRGMYTDIISGVKDSETGRRKKVYTAVVDINPYSFI